MASYVPYNRPHLRQPVQQLLSRLQRVIREGGRLPVAALIDTVGGGRLDAEGRRLLAGRGDLVFRYLDAQVRFENVAPAVTLHLRRLDLTIPEIVAGNAYVFGEDGVQLRFDEDHAPTAVHWASSVRFRGIELTRKYVYFALEGNLRDQCVLVE